MTYVRSFLWSKFSGLSDLVLSLAVIPAAYLLLLYRRAGAAKFPKTTARLRHIGLFPVRAHYYEPLFDHRHLAKPLDEDRDLPGIDLNEAGQRALLGRLSCRDELVELGLDRPAGEITSFSLGNNQFQGGDADFLYQWLRLIKPAVVVEIGSGNSTKIACVALEQNRRETGKVCEHICIEPYEQPWLERLDSVTVIRKKVEDCDFDWVSKLKAGDLLFVDSSHIIRPQGDVLTEYLEIFPRLAAGVYVHIHDIFTPKDYPKSWVVDDVRFWNEQYLLEALLTNTDRYRIVAALNFLKHNHYDDLSAVCPYLAPENEPGSFYFRVEG